MKKRAKIITTVASLCLAVALMAFGVYAATQVTLSITSEVSFTVTDVFVTIDGQAYLSDVPQEDPAFQYVSYNEVSGVKTAKSSGQANQAETWEFADIAFKANQTEVKYVIRVTNDHGTDSVTVSLATLEFKSVANTKRYATVVVWDASANEGAGAYAAAAANGTNETANVAGDYAFTTSSFTVLPGKYVEFTLVRTLIDNSVAIAENSASLAGNITVAHV